MKLLKSLVITFLLFTATANLSFAQVKTTIQPSDSLVTANIKVKGITCSTDLKMISANVEKLKGVSSCKAGKQGPTSSFEIKYNPTLVTEKEIFAAIEETGSCENPDERAYKVKQ